MSTATTGRRREHKVSHHMQAHGWRQITRAAASKGPVDLWMLHDAHGGAVVQVGSDSKRLGPADRHDLLTVAAAFHALPILARVIKREGIQYLLVNPGPRWEAWTP